MKAKKLMFFVSILCVLVVAECIVLVLQKEADYDSTYVENGIHYISKTEGREFYIYQNGEWTEHFLGGVNIGATVPGYFPGELGISKEDYLRWFGYIRDMNVDVIRVYTTLMPAFYEALYEFNEGAESPLYLIQGVWVNEEDTFEIADAYGEGKKIYKDFVKDATDLVDVIHGNAKLPERAGFASGTYTKDVSEYVIGWILGTEWDPYFVEGTNSKNPRKNTYHGEYLYTENASPFEVFLCEVGDNVLKYEATKYHMTRALSFANWPTTDMLSHPNEPNEKEDMVSVNMEHIKPGTKCLSGLFASYHIYPFYPDFINLDQKYVSFVDEEGNINTYKAYLRELFQNHTMPVLVAEYGVPSARGKAHNSDYSGYHQGNHSEEEQGQICASLLQDIYDEGYCGALLFMWQDEWFKMSWNTTELDVSSKRPMWLDVQTNEQMYGMLAFDPGTESSVCYVDGDVAEWKRIQPISNTGNAILYMQQDEKYLYFMVDTNEYDFDNDELIIALDTIPDQGNQSDNLSKLQFNSEADFLIRISGEDESKVLVDPYYDVLYFQYWMMMEPEERSGIYSQKNTGEFVPIYQCLSRPVTLPETGIMRPFLRYETGKLLMGNANPESEEYNSLADFTYKDGFLEIKIPWLLINVRDPSSKRVINDFNSLGEINSKAIFEIRAGVQIVKDGNGEEKTVEMESFRWDGWEKPTYHERLKLSYYIMQEAYKKLNE